MAIKKELKDIKIWNSTKKELDKLKVIPSESYDSALQRIIKSGTVKPIEAIK